MGRRAPVDLAQVVAHHVLAQRVEGQGGLGRDGCGPPLGRGPQPGGQGGHGVDPGVDPQGLGPQVALGCDWPGPAGRCGRSRTGRGGPRPAARWAARYSSSTRAPAATDGSSTRNVVGPEAAPAPPADRWRRRDRLVTRSSADDLVADRHPVADQLAVQRQVGPGQAPERGHAQGHHAGRGQGPQLGLVPPGRHHHQHRGGGHQPPTGPGEHAQSPAGLAVRGTATRPRRGVDQLARGAPGQLGVGRERSGGGPAPGTASALTSSGIDEGAPVHGRQRPRRPHQGQAGPGAGGQAQVGRGAQVVGQAHDVALDGSGSTCTDMASRIMVATSSVDMTGASRSTTEPAALGLEDLDLGVVVGIADRRCACRKRSSWASGRR